MRKCASSIGRTKPTDATRPYLPMRGLGMTRSVGNAAWLMRHSTLPSPSLRIDVVRTPSSTASHVTSGMSAICSTNWVPLQDDDVERVDQVLVVLQPVARDDLRPATADAAVVGFQELALVETLERVVARQHGLPV